MKDTDAKLTDEQRFAFIEETNDASSVCEKYVKTVDRIYRVNKLNNEQRY